MTSYRLLIVDDEKVERDALEFIVSTSGLPIGEIRQAQNGREALADAEESKPDIAFMDIKMPGMNGIETARELRRLCPETHVIYLSAFSSFDYARDAFRTGADDFLVKPASREQVEEVLARVIERVDAEDRRRRERESERRRLAKLSSYLEREFVASPLIGEVDEARTGRGAPEAGPIERACFFLEAHYQEDFSLEEIASHFGLSMFYFGKLFKQRTGITFVDYLCRLRIRSAKELLRGGVSVKETSVRVGYRDPNYFSRVFRRVTGSSPSEYRDTVAG